jgi:tetratricopeptide (TPR) repeat protein
MKDFLISVFQEASPMQRERGAPLSIQELLDSAERRIDVELASEPLLQADLWDDLAETRASAGEYDAASALIDKALAAKRAHLDRLDPSLVESLGNRAAISNILATESNRQLEQLGPNAGNGLRERHASELARHAESALVTLDEADAILRQRGEADSKPAVNLTINRVLSLIALERHEEAAIASERASALADRFAPDSVDAAMQHHNSGLIALRRGQHAEARRHFLTAIERVERILGADHAVVAIPLLALADLLENRMGDVAASIPYYERALAITKLHYPEGNPELVEKQRDLSEARAKLAAAVAPPP